MGSCADIGPVIIIILEWAITDVIDMNSPTKCPPFILNKGLSKCHIGCPPLSVVCYPEIAIIFITIGLEWSNSSGPLKGLLSA